MLSVAFLFFPECHYTEGHFATCHHAESLCALILLSMLSIIMQNVSTPIAIIPSVIMLKVMGP